MTGEGEKHSVGQCTNRGKEEYPPPGVGWVFHLDAAVRIEQEQHVAFLENHQGKQ